MASITLSTKSGGTIAASTGADQFWSFLRGLFNTTTSVISTTLWKYVPGTYEKDFISAHTVLNPTGSSATATNLSHQSIYSFRSGAGGIMYVNTLEDISTNLQRAPLVPLSNGTASQQMANYVIGANAWMIARDNGFAIAALNQTGGQNEAIFKARNR
jgi:hypothetical protein